METLPMLSNADLDTLSQAHEELVTERPEGQAVVLVPSNPLHKELILTTLNAAGQTPEKYPYLYEVVNNGQFSPDGTPDNLIIAAAGATRNGIATATTWLSNNNGTLYSFASVFVLDDTTNELLAFGSDTDVQSGLMRNYTNAQTAGEANTSVRILGVNYMVDHEGAVKFTAIAGIRTADYFDASQDPPQAPVISVDGHTSVHIAIGRNSSTNPNNDADYYYSEPQPVDNPNLIIPFVGSFTIPYPIDTSKPIAFVSNIYVDYATSSSEVVDLTTTVTTQITSSGNTVQWNFPYDRLPASQTQSLVYQNGDANDKLSAVFFQFTVQLVSGAPVSSYTFTACSHPGPLPTSSISLPDLKFWWHCLADGTQVTLADGTLMNIEALHNGHRVLSGPFGATLCVEATTLGHHRSTEKQVGKQGIYRLRTKDGKEIIATGAHPIMTPSGAVMTCYLKSGDQVLVTEGVSAVDICEAVDYSAIFYDLKLGNTDDRAKAGQNPVNSYYANGILVGDHLAMNAQADRQRYDLDFIIPRIDADFQTDYASAVKDRKS